MWFKATCSHTNTQATLWEQIHIMIVSAVFQVDSHAMSHLIVTHSFELCEVQKS